MFKTETHLHTKETSTCSHLTGAEMVRLSHDAGYQTVFASDHMHADFAEKNSDVSPRAAAERFLRGYQSAKAEAQKYGMNVLLSVEYSLCFGNVHNHYLLYGIDEDFITAYPNGKEMTLQKLRKVTRENGVLLIQAHPFRGTCFPTPFFVDGMEIYNSNPRHFVDTDEERTAEVIRLYDLYTTAGSDAHQLPDIAGTGMGSEYEIKTAADYIELIKSGKGIVLKNK